MTSLAAFGMGKFPSSGLLRGSAGRGWTGIAADLRAHPAGEIAEICPTQMEVTLAIAGARDGIVQRRGDGALQRTPVRRGTLWFCPIGIREDSIHITEPLPEILHLYIPPRQFEALGEIRSRPVRSQDIFYLADVDDELIRQIGYRVLRELQQETAGGTLLIEQLALSLVAHLAASYSHQCAAPTGATRPGALDARRLKRVEDYIFEHLDSDLTLADLAEVACLSRHHFARAFREAKGSPPHRYLSARRLERACDLLEHTDLTLVEIALKCRFSSQASFTRAFHRGMGVSPGEYRRHRTG
ncbi:AraC family transcriptional regulator [Nostoc sp. 3335mG]|nr:AraC family transcriptional regulator [Nostoc sp. 3335mG]